MVASRNTRKPRKLPRYADGMQRVLRADAKIHRAQAEERRRKCINRSRGVNVDMQSAQRAADGRNNGHGGTRQAQTEAPANTPDRIDTSCITTNANNQPRPKQPKTAAPTTPPGPRTRSPPRNGKISVCGGASDEQVGHRPNPWRHPPDPWVHTPNPWGHPPDPRARWTSNRAQLTLARRRESGTTTAEERPLVIAKTWQER
jgi:hypothetical protein